MARVAHFVLVMIAGCGHQPQLAGATREAAVPIELVAGPGLLRGATEDVVMTTAGKWFRIDLPGDRREHVEVVATVHGAGAIEIELLAADGGTLDHGPGLAHADDARGRIYVRVTGTVHDYGLAVTSRASPESPVAGSACNVHDIDPANPRCSGVVACDPNRPDFTNPACCDVVCIRDCGTTLEPIAGTRFAWIDKGATTGINIRYRGRGWIAVPDGSGTSFAFNVASVERTRAKVVIPSNVSMDAIAHATANLVPPVECGGSAD